MPLNQVGTTDVGTGARFTQPRVGWVRRVAWCFCLLWLAGHGAALIAAPSHSGLPEWSSLEGLFGARMAVVSRLVFMACFGALGWHWAGARLRLQGDVARLWRVGATLTLAFLILHVLHVRAVFRVADIGHRLPEINDRLAATLAGTHWGVPWLSLAYMLGSIAAGILCGVELWLALAKADAARDSWRKQRTRRFLSVCAGILVGSVSLRALVYFATGAAVWH